MEMDNPILDESGCGTYNRLELVLFPTIVRCATTHITQPSIPLRFGYDGLGSGFSVKSKICCRLCLLILLADLHDGLQVPSNISKREG